MKSYWEENRPRILLFADIMGFKALIGKTEHSELVKQFRDFTNQLIKLIEPLKTGKHLRLTIFSDSIVIGADSCTIKNFNLIVKAAALLMCTCYRFSLPINGCISCGNLAFDVPENAENEVDVPIILGDSVVKAHLLNEDLFCYGIILHPSAEELLENSLTHKEKKFHHPFFHLPIPLKSGGFARLNYLLWPAVHISINNEKIKIEDEEKWLVEIEKNDLPRVRAYVHNTREILSQIQNLKL